MKRLDRRALFASGAAAAVLAATGISAAPKRGGRLRAALSGAARTDSWADPASGLFMRVAGQGILFDTLTEIAADGTLRSELARSWTSDAAGRNWVFELRDDVIFHDGQPLRSEDVVASIGRRGGFERIETLQDGRVAIALRAGDPNLPFRLGGPDHVIQPADESRRDLGVGTGLYRLRQFNPGQHLLVERVENHYKGDAAGWFDMVELVSVPAEDVRVQALNEHLVDTADVRDRPRMLPRADFHCLPDDNDPAQILSKDVGLPARIGQHWPLDNYRMAERWWFS